MRFEIIDDNFLTAKTLSELLRPKKKEKKKNLKYGEKKNRRKLNSSET